MEDKKCQIIKFWESSVIGPYNINWFHGMVVDTTGNLVKVDYGFRRWKEDGIGVADTVVFLQDKKVHQGEKMKWIFVDSDVALLRETSREIMTYLEDWGWYSGTNN